MQASLEAVDALVPAVITALRASTTLNNLLDTGTAKGVHDGDAPNPTQGAQPTKYIVVRSPSASAEGVFGSVGANCALELHVWHPLPGESEVRSIVAAIGVALEGVALSLGGGFRHWSSACFLIGSFNDTQAKPPMKHGVVRYEARVQ